MLCKIIDSFYLSIEFKNKFVILLIDSLRLQIANSPLERCKPLSDSSLLLCNRCVEDTELWVLLSAMTADYIMQLQVQSGLTNDTLNSQNTNT